MADWPQGQCDSVNFSANTSKYISFQLFLHIVTYVLKLVNILLVVFLGGGDLLPQ